MGILPSLPPSLVPMGLKVIAAFDPESASVTDPLSTVTMVPMGLLSDSVKLYSACENCGELSLTSDTETCTEVVLQSEVMEYR